VARFSTRLASGLRLRHITYPQRATLPARSSVACTRGCTLPLVPDRVERQIVAAYPGVARYYYFDLNQNSQTRISVSLASSHSCRTRYLSGWRRSARPQRRDRAAPLPPAAPHLVTTNGYHWRGTSRVPAPATGSPNPTVISRLFSTSVLS
jgi:hypothetical protein